MTTMMILKAKYLKHIYLIAFILMQLPNHNTAENISCFVCGVNDTAACTDNRSEVLQVCPEGYTNCYTKVDANGRIERGCLQQGQEKTCNPNEGCVLTGAGKNNQLICKKCDSSDENCSQTDMKLNDHKYNDICDADVKSCIKKVDEKLVVRRCASVSDVQKCTNPITCKLCESVNCNTGIFPDARLKCYQCNGSKCNDVTESKLTSKPCLNYEEHDECYTKGENEETMIRGCKSDIKENKCSSSGNGCSFCGESDCNNLKYKREQKLNCYQCASNVNSDCVKEQTHKNFTKCEKEILYNEQEYCYTAVENGNTERGCLHDKGDLNADKCIDQVGGACSKCNQTEGCNNQPVALTCIVCRSDINAKCWNKAGECTSQKCAGESTPSDGCFHGIWNGIAIRDCLSNAAEQIQAICRDVKDHTCTACFTPNCNVDRSWAPKMVLSHALLILASVMLWQLK